MTIDEAIEKFKFIANSDDPCPRYCMLPCDKCVDESKQLADWLEELKVYQQHEIICHKGYNAGYNKAIDDFANACKSNTLCQTFGLRQCDIDKIAEQLKWRR